MKGKPREDQEWITLNGKQVIVDKDFSLLLTELNRVGLITEYHCAGHEEEYANPYICFNMAATKACHIEVEGSANSVGTPRLIIRWKRFDSAGNISHWAQ